MASFTNPLPPLFPADIIVAIIQGWVGHQASQKKVSTTVCGFVLCNCISYSQGVLICRIQLDCSEVFSKLIKFIFGYFHPINTFFDNKNK